MNSEGRPLRPYITDRVPPEPERSQIIRGLIALRKAGEFQAIWIDADRIRVRKTILETPYRLLWSHAKALLEVRRSSSEN